MQTRRYVTGLLCCLAATISWGAMFPVMTDALRHMDPFTFTALRYSLAGLAFLALLLVREGVKSLSLKGERWGLAWLFGSAGFAGFGFLVFLGQKLAGPSGALTASIMMATMPMLGMFVIWALRKVRPPLFSFVFISTSFAGIVTVITKGNLHALLVSPAAYVADLPIVIGALCWVIYTVGASYFPKWSAYRYTTVTTLLGLTTVFAIDLVLLALGVIPEPTLSAVAAVAPQLLYMAFVAGFIGVLCWNIGNKILTPLNGVLFMDVVPITAFTVSALTGVVPVPMQITGATITAISLLMNNIYQRRRVQKAAVAVTVASPAATPLAKECP
ncbi:DMT family transporter [Thiomonas sp.]